MCRCAEELKGKLARWAGDRTECKRQLTYGRSANISVDSSKQPRTRTSISPTPKEHTSSPFDFFRQLLRGIERCIDIGTCKNWGGRERGCISEACTETRKMKFVGRRSGSVQVEVHSLEVRRRRHKERYHGIVVDRNRVARRPWTAYFRWFDYQFGIAGQLWHQLSETESNLN